MFVEIFLLYSKALFGTFLGNKRGPAFHTGPSSYNFLKRFTTVAKSFTTFWFAFVSL